MRAVTGDATDPDDALYARCVDDLVTAVDLAIGPWVERSVRRVADAWRPGAGDGLTEAAATAGEEARRDVVPRLRALLALDVDQQPTGPLAVVRTAVGHPTAVLRSVGVPPVSRDEFAVAAFPDDAYDLVPGSFRDLDESVHEPGIRWGAAKAHRVLARRRDEGRR